MAYEFTLLRAAPGRRLAKRYRDPAKAPDDYDAGLHFVAAEMRCKTFAQFVRTLERLGPDQCLIRGAARNESRADVTAGLEVRRLEYEDTDPDTACPGVFEGVARNWIVLDADHTDAPMDPADVEGSIARWRETLPAEIREAQSAFFLSASSHRHNTVRGKLLVALAEPLDNYGAAAYARAHGFDGSVCHTVQPNYFAAPIFAGCRDPLDGKRKPVVFAGKPARVTVPDIVRPPREGTLGARDATPANLPPLSERADALAAAIVDTWAGGGRIETNAALHLFGWLLGRGWSKGEIGSMLALLDVTEPSAAKRAEHWHILGNARAIDGPGGAREWLGETFDAANAVVNHDPGREAFEARAEARAVERYRSASELAEAEIDEWATFESFEAPTKKVEYLCEGLRLAPSRGKISLIAGNAGGGKGPIADHLAVCFALGLKAFGAHECKQAKVLLIDIEGATLSQLRMRRMCKAMGVDHRTLEGRVLHKDASTIGDLTSPENQEAIARIVERYGVEVVIVDSYTTAMLASGIDANTPQYAMLAQLLGRLGVLAICVAHANKSSARNGEPTLADVAYSQALGALAQTALVVHYPDREHSNRVSVGCARAPETRFAPFDVEFRDTDDGGLAVTIAEPQQAPVVERAPGIVAMRNRMASVGTNADRVLDLLGRLDSERCGCKIITIRDHLGLDKRAWAAAWEEILKRGDGEECGLPTDRHVMVRLVRRE